MELFSGRRIEEQYLKHGDSLISNDPLHRQTFYTFSHTLYAADVAIQKCLKHDGAVHDRKLHITGKHKL